MDIRRLGWLAFVAAAGISAAQGAGEEHVIISEFMAANSHTLRDRFREYSDWIELYNDGDDPVDLAGWALTDDPDDPAKWVFPSVVLDPGEYLIVFASGRDIHDLRIQLHTNFSLNADGEYLALVDPEGQTAFAYEPEYPPQRGDVSYGVRDGRPYYFETPTPGKPNVGGDNNFVADTKFSVDRGFYEQPFFVSITCETPGAVIRYTTNGSPPAADTGLVYTGPIRIAGTTVLRAAAFKEGMLPSNVDTQTYIFLDDVLHQSPDGRPPPGWPSSWGRNTVDYGMDPEIVNDPKYGPKLKDAFRSLPSFSIAMDLADLFDSQTGIYANANRQGRLWERPCSVELLYPDGKKGFQINCGIRIRGGFSRSGGNPKHAFRLFFRQAYGSGKLRYPLFDDQGADEFDCVDLRTFQNYSWSFQGDSRGIFVRDQWNRDTQLAMGHQAERGKFYHLFINGQYWGLYNTCERPEASYGATYYGGRKNDYDVIKVEAGPYTISPTDGDINAWKRLYNACKAGLESDAAYERIQGRNPDGTPNPDYENLVDVDNLIDYMFVILYGGNLDAPISNFLGNTRPNNWYGIRNRTGLSGGFKFFVHDAEHTLLNAHENRIGPFPAGESSLTYSNPQWVWQKMWANKEFRMRVADRAQKFFFHDGALTPEACLARFNKRIQEIDLAVYAESARWGDAKRSRPLTHDDWLNAVNNVRNNFFPQRTAIVLDQLRSKGLYPPIDAPEFNQFGGRIDPGFRLRISAPQGTIWYTLDGSDPRLRGGAVSPTARRYTAQIPLTESTVVKARALSGDTWSALSEAAFLVRQSFDRLLLTELMYHPRAEAQLDGDEFEFIEIKNAGDAELDLSGAQFTDGIEFVFPFGFRLGAGEFAVLVRNPEAFAQRYPEVPIAGVYTGALNNAGERVTLADPEGTPIFSVRYQDALPWPPTADGQGFSLVPIQPNANPDPDNPASWRASAEIDGSPGRDDPAPGIPPVVINELLTHTDPPMVDWVELYNPNDQPADISHWLLTDDSARPNKFAIPAGVVIPPHGFRVFTEADFNPHPGQPPSFTFNSHGEEAFLFSADSEGRLTGYVDGFRFGAAANGVSFGRYTNSVGEVLFPAQKALTPEAPNAGPRIGPVVINEIGYHPPPGKPEFVELLNITDRDVPLYHLEWPTNTWRLKGIDFSFPTNTTLPARGLALIVNVEPEAFRQAYPVPAGVPIFGPFHGALQDNGERLALQMPDKPDFTTNGTEVTVFVPYIDVDVVRYDNRSPWPEQADGNGPSLERIHAEAFGNDPDNWRASFGPPSPGVENNGNRAPMVEAGQDQQLTAETFPLSVELKGWAEDDGLPEKPGKLALAWSQIDGPGRAVILTPGRTNAQALLPGSGLYTFQLTASDGELAVSDTTAIEVERPGPERAFIPLGSVWKYLDDGSDQGTSWRETDFDDSAWPEGPAQLGYGDGDEATVLDFGPDSQHKRTTYYFRRIFQVADPGGVKELTLRVQRDDGVAVYLNGTEIFRDNLPSGEIHYDTWANTAVGGSEETRLLETAVDPTLLRTGTNLIAVEIHQANPTSSDISFDLALEGTVTPTNRPPSVDAGPDLTLEGPGSAQLEGSFQDDGLPEPPGAVSAQWRQKEGPAEVSFADPNGWITEALFPEPGLYLLELVVEDGQCQAKDTVKVQVGAPPEPPRIEAARLVRGEKPKLQLDFTAPGAKGCRIEWKRRLEDPDWETVVELEFAPGAETVHWEIPLDLDSPSGFYRIVVP